MKTQGETSGVLYIAFGEQFREEARVSMASLRSTSPEVKIAVITDRSWEWPSPPDEVLVREHVDGWRCKPLYMGDSPFHKTLFLDTDTLVVRDITAVFKLLNYYDVGVNFGGAQLKTGDLETHCQCNSGVILYKMVPAVREAFDLWLREYSAVLEEKKESDKWDARGLGDQRYLAVAIAKSKARPVHLANYLNFFIHDYNVLYTPPAIIHGRIHCMEGLAGQMGVEKSWRANVDYVARLWMPNARGMLPNGIRRSDPLLAVALLCRRMVNEVRRRWHAARCRRTRSVHSRRRPEPVGQDGK